MSSEEMKEKELMATTTIADDAIIMEEGRGADKNDGVVIKVGEYSVSINKISYSK